MPYLRGFDLLQFVRVVKRHQFDLASLLELHTHLKR